MPTHPGKGNFTVLYIWVHVTQFIVPNFFSRGIRLRGKDVTVEGLQRVYENKSALISLF